MSLTGKDRKIRSPTEKVFLDRAPLSDVESFATAIAGALRREFGENPAAVKEVARRAGANERAVKNWFDAKNAPNGQLLVNLIGHSDQVLECVLALARRDQLLKTKRIQDTRRELLELLSKLHGLLS